MRNGPSRIEFAGIFARRGRYGSPVPELDYIQPANPWQTGELEELMRRSSMHWEAYREALSAHPEAIHVSPAHIAAGHVRVAYDHNGDTVGFSCVLPATLSDEPTAADAGDGTFVLDALFVDPLEFGLGIGRGLIADVFAYVRRHGGSVVTVIAGPEAIGFYERLGFARVGDARTRFGPAHHLRAEV
jgi:GNAT superfamily N-acetyltransferase